MNIITDTLSYVYSSVIESPAANELFNARTVGAALAGIALVAASYSCFGSQCKKDPQMLRLFEERWRIENPFLLYTPMRGYIAEKDTALLSEIFDNWRLDSGLGFFDLLGVDLYRKMKNQGTTKIELSRFAKACNYLTGNLTLVANGADPTAVYPYIRDVREVLKTIDVPEQFKREHQFFLKMLSDPKKTVTLGISSLSLLEQGEKLSQGETSMQDISDFLDYRADGDSFFAPLRDTKTTTSEINPKRLLKLSNQLLKQLHSKEYDEIINQRNFTKTALNQIQNMIEARFFSDKIDFLRFLQIYTRLYQMTKPIDHWIKNMYAEYISPSFLNCVEPTVETGFDGTFERWEMTELLGSGRTMKNFKLQEGARTLANGCKSISLVKLKSLESKIVDILKRAQYEGAMTEEDYANLFTEMLRLYLLAHDIQAIQNPAKNYLGGRLFPESFEPLFCLRPLTEEQLSQASLFDDLSEEKDDETEETRQTDLVTQAIAPVTQAIAPVAQAIASKTAPAAITQKKKKERTPQKDEKEYKVPPLPPAIEDDATDVPVVRPYFPKKNVTARHIIPVLLNGGFVIDRVEGSHYQMEHLATGVKTTVPYHDRPLKKGTLASVRNAFYQSQGVL